MCGYLDTRIRAVKQQTKSKKKMSTAPKLLPNYTLNQNTDYVEVSIID